MPDPTALSGADVDPAVRRRIHRLLARAHSALAGSEPGEGRDAQPAAAGATPVEGKVPATIDAVGLLKQIRPLLAEVEDEELLASELATLAGELLSGRGLVFLCGSAAERILRGYRMTDAQVEDISHTLIRQVRETQKPLVVTDVEVHEEVRRIRSLRSARARSVICWPVIRDGVTLGVLYVDHREPGRLSVPQAERVMEEVASIAAGLLLVMSRRHSVTRHHASDFGLIGTSPAMRELGERIAQIQEARERQSIILLQGETGTGKSMLARQLHALSEHRHGPFISVSCATIPSELFESEAFGTRPGAFNGATESPGWFEQARDGTLFLDEFGELRTDHQQKLLLVLQDRTFRRLKDTRERRFSGQVILATHRKLHEEVANNRFRADLFYRVNANTLVVPSLRERGVGDIRLLCAHMIEAQLKKHRPRRPVNQPLAVEDYISRQAQEFLYAYAWPGNVRELENIFKSSRTVARLLSEPPIPLTVEDVRDALGPIAGLLINGGASSASDAMPPPGLTYEGLREWRRDVGRRYVERLYEANGRNKKRTAELLGCSRDVVHKLLKGSVADDD